MAEPYDLGPFDRITSFHFDEEEADGDIFLRTGTSQYAVIRWDGSIVRSFETAGKPFDGFQVLAAVGNNVVLQDTFNSPFTTYVVDANSDDLDVVSGPFDFEDFDTSGFGSGPLDIVTKNATQFGWRGDSTDLFPSDPGPFCGVLSNALAALSTVQNQFNTGGIGVLHYQSIDVREKIWLNWQTDQVQVLDLTDGTVTTQSFGGGAAQTLVLTSNENLVLRGTGGSTLQIKTLDGNFSSLSGAQPSNRLNMVCDNENLMIIGHDGSGNIVAYHYDIGLGSFFGIPFWVIGNGSGFGLSGVATEISDAFDNSIIDPADFIAVADFLFGGRMALLNRGY